MIFTRSFTHLEKIFHDKYELSSTIRHRGERGKQRENGLLSFLRETLPAAYGVATGEIIPYLGPDPSPQCDIIIYDQLHMPVLNRADAVQQVPLEAVYAVIECKSVLNSSAIKDAKQKFAMIRALPRCPSKDKLRKDSSPGPEFFLFGYKFATTIQACKQFVQSSPEDRDIHIAALDKGGAIWVDFEDESHCVWLTMTDQKQSLYQTLVLFYVDLLESLRNTDLGNPSYVRMFWNEE